MTTSEATTSDAAIAAALDTLPAHQLFIAGQWVPAADGGTRAVLNPATGAAFTEVSEATSTDAEAAIAAARTAFDAGQWSGSAITDRAKVVAKIAELLVRDRDSIAVLETLDTGKTLAESQIDIDDVVSVFEYYAALAHTQSDRLVDVGNPAVVSRVVAEPIGVCALIAPWNYPLLQISWKIAPALVAGCTMVAKPSEVTPLTTIILAKLAAEAGVPDGVLNLIQGAGSVVGPTLTSSPDVDFISFTGGLTTGTAISAAAASNVTKVAVELGGKNPHIVFADADWESSVDQVLTGAFLHSGQVCSAGTRLIVEDSIADKFVAELAARAKNIWMGDGLDPTSETGPLVSQAQLDKMHEFVDSAAAEGATLVAGGHRPERSDLTDGGFWFSPTIFDDCDRSMRIVREETFGPILTVERFHTESEAITLGNDTDYGLAGAVRTADTARAERVARALRHGTIWINDFGYYTAAAEWGGFGKSGNGRELGPTGLAEYQELKHIWSNTAPTPSRWFTHTKEITDDSNGS